MSTLGPIFPVQGWTYRLNHADYLLAATPKMVGSCIAWTEIHWELDLDIYYPQLQRWLQLSRFCYYVLGWPLVHNCDYEAVRMAAIKMHEELPDENPVPNYWYWNHLPCRYDHWCRQLFDTIPLEARSPRYPWKYGEGIYRKPLDFSAQPAIIVGDQGRVGLSSGKSMALGKMSYQFD